MTVEVEFYSADLKIHLYADVMVLIPGYFQEENQLFLRQREELIKQCRVVMKWIGFVPVKKMPIHVLNQNPTSQKPDHLTKWLLWVFLLSDFRVLTRNLN